MYQVHFNYGAGSDDSYYYGGTYSKYVFDTEEEARGWADEYMSIDDGSYSNTPISFSVIELKESKQAWEDLEHMRKSGCGT